MTTELELKQALYNEYDGFADKRHKKLDSNNTFMIDDRSPGDHGADNKLLSYFCMMFASVESPRRVRVRLLRNVPSGQAVKAWAQKYRASSTSTSLEFDVTPERLIMLDELARAVEAIVSAGGYKIKSYKYVCPRVANCLRRLAGALRMQWR